MALENPERFLIPRQKTVVENYFGDPKFKLNVLTEQLQKTKSVLYWFKDFLRKIETSLGLEGELTRFQDLFESYLAEADKETLLKIKADKDEMCKTICMGVLNDIISEIQADVTAKNQALIDRNNDIFPNGFTAVPSKNFNRVKLSRLIDLYLLFQDPPYLSLNTILEHCNFDNLFFDFDLYFDNKKLESLKNFLQRKVLIAPMSIVFAIRENFNDIATLQEHDLTPATTQEVLFDLFFYGKNISSLIKYYKDLEEQFSPIAERLERNVEEKQQEIYALEAEIEKKAKPKNKKSKA